MTYRIRRADRRRESEQYHNRNRFFRRLEGVYDLRESMKKYGCDEVTKAWMRDDIESARSIRLHSLTMPESFPTIP